MNAFQSMAYALLAGVPPLYGLYASVVPLLVFPLFSTSRVQAAGPTALDSLLTFSTMGAILSAEQLDDPATTVALAVVLAFVTGILQLIMGALRLGVLVNFLSYSVMSGFTSAAAFIIGFSQLKHIFGITEVPRYTGSFRDIRTFGNVVSRLGETNGWTFFMSSVCVVILLCMRHWKKNVYNKDTATSRQRTLKMVVDFSALVIAVLGVIWAVIYNAAGIVVRSASDKSPLPGNATQFVDVVGDVPSGLPPFAVPDISRFSDRGSDLIFGCSIIALVAFMELYAIARVYAEQRRYPLDANQELVAMGAANVFGSLFQAYPAGGSFSRTAVNANAGANTLLSCLLQGILVALALVAIAPSFFFIPMGALAAIVEVSIINLVKINDFKEAWRLHKWGDLAVMSLTFSVTLCFGIQEGIGLGVLLSIIVTMKHSAFPNVVELGQLPDRLVFRDVNEAEDALQFDAVSIVRIDAELYFANTNYFRGHVMRRTRDHHVIVIDCSVVTELDLQAVHMLNDLLDDVRERKVRLMFAQMRARVRRIFQRSGLSEKIGEENMFIDLSDAVTHAAEAVEEIERRKAAGASSKARGSKPVSSRDLMKSWKERKATPGGSGSDSKAGGGTPSVPEESSAGNSDNEDGAEGDAGGVAAAAVAESHESAQEEAKA